MLKSKSQILHFNDSEGVIKSSFRTMAIFEFFADVATPMSVGNISKHLKIPQSSTSSLLRSLLNTGYLAYDHNSRKVLPHAEASLFDEVESL